MKNVNQNLTVPSTDISSTQEWTCDPDLIEIYIGSAFLEKAKVCVDFMQSQEVDQVKIWFAFGYEMFQDIDNVIEEDVSVAVNHNDHEYVKFEPEYRLDGCHAQIDRDGDVRAEFAFKHTSDKLWADIGNIKTLREQLSGSERGSANDATHSTEPQPNPARSEAPRRGL
ncbi:hypothetical protein [Pandoraea cepalis]|uniref:Uncharacterized protein n=1 Tax=Pandoraea cepalis TaxID=2508294 RepID=A0A5E4VWI2_9BURK|nr:hypothetical protein [Pandoraea cepalis]VVE16947.1 hypothetical protein PCE31107_02945 [Pandoraea cepalis]